MSGRLSVLLATRSAGSPSGPGIRHIWASSSQNFAADAARGGASKLPGPNSVSGRINKLETEIEGVKVTTDTLSKRQDVINTYQDNADRSLKWLTQLGYATGVLGIGGAMFKFYHYDVSQTNQIKAYIREVGGNLESRMERMESRMEKKIGNLESKMDQKIGNLELKMEKMDQRIGNLELKMEKMDQRIGNLESKMDQKIGNLESKMDQKIGNLELKMDRRMDEIVSYLQVKKGWW